MTPFEIGAVIFAVLVLVLLGRIQQDVSEIRERLPDVEPDDDLDEA